MFRVRNYNYTTYYLTQQVHCINLGRDVWSPAVGSSECDLYRLTRNRRIECACLAAVERDLIAESQVS